MRWIQASTVLLCSMTMVLLGASLAGADPRSYENFLGEGDHFLLCSMDGSRIGIGGVCWPGGHIVPDSLGEATLTIFDQFTSPASGFYCQDVNHDMVCGADLGLGVDVTEEFKLRGPGGGRNAAEKHFCGSVTIHSMLFEEPIWIVTDPVYVFIDGPINGALLNPCGTLYSGGFLGEVNHS